jgi:UDP-glucose 4-epimerase
MKALVTGAAGFIGSHLTDRLLADGHAVVGYDNLSSGRREFLADALRHPAFTLVEADTLDLDRLAGAARGCDTLFHLAANADVRFGLDRPRRDLEQNTVATWTALEAARRAGVARFAFASTGSVYGEPAVHPTPEDAPFPVQTSLYGASKLAGEGLVQAYATGFGLVGRVYRFVSVLGPRYTHGHLFDFVKALRADPSRLRVLGDGRQRKSYMHVSDCVEGVLAGLERSPDRLAVFNLGTDETSTPRDSVAWVCEELGVSPAVEYTGGERGWVGDSPYIWLDCRRARSLGWAPRHSIREAARETVRYLRQNPWALERS